MFIVDGNDDTGRGQVGQVLLVQALSMPDVRNSPLQRNLVTEESVEPVGVVQTLVLTGGLFRRRQFGRSALLSKATPKRTFTKVAKVVMLYVFW